MSTTHVPTPTSHLRFGHARADITPPVGIYHPMWGAARHHRATGVHRPLVADVIAIGPIGAGQPLIKVHMDWCTMVNSLRDELRGAIGAETGLPADRVLLSTSHTHASGVFGPDRRTMPGGELIPAYLADMRTRLLEACRQAMAGMVEAYITYGTGRCNMAANRDFWDEAFGGYTCGYNPDAPADDTLLVARVTDATQRPVAILVNYACHATTLAWENTLISPDYVGALREAVEQAADVPCVFMTGACGDLGPRQGYTGDTAIADKNGRQVAYAALSTLQAMGPAAADFVYQGPVISGATLGTWAHVPLTPERLAAAERFAGGLNVVDLPLKPKPARADLEAQREEWLARQREADARGETLAARDYGARAERARRWLGRLDSIPDGQTYPFHYAVLRLGDAIWVTTGGEPYSYLQVELRRRFPQVTVLVSPVTGEQPVAYLLPADRYGKGLYQEEPSILAQGCLELLIEAIAARIEALL